jgi:hypothetical protein
MVQSVHAPARQHRCRDPFAHAKIRRNCRPAGAAAEIPHPGDAERACPGDRDTSSQPRRMYICPDNGIDFRGFVHTDHSLPVWRGPGLRTMRLHCLDGPGGRGASPAGWAAPGRASLYGVRPYWQSMEGPEEACAAGRRRSSGTFSLQHTVNHQPKRDARNA